MANKLIDTANIDALIKAAEILEERQNEENNLVVKSRPSLLQTKPITLINISHEPSSEGNIFDTNHRPDIHQYTLTVTSTSGGDVQISPSPSHIYSPISMCGGQKSIFDRDTRKAHNQLEKHRRADLKTRFERLKDYVPNTKGKRCSSLAILRGATRNVEMLARRTREYEMLEKQLTEENRDLEHRREQSIQKLEMNGIDSGLVLANAAKAWQQRDASGTTVTSSSSLIVSSLCGEVNTTCTTAAIDGMVLSGSGHSGSSSVSGSGGDRMNRRTRPRERRHSSGSRPHHHHAENESTTTASECGEDDDIDEATDDASECGGASGDDLETTSPTSCSTSLHHLSNHQHHALITCAAPTVASGTSQRDLPVKKRRLDWGSWQENDLPASSSLSSSLSSTSAIGGNHGNTPPATTGSLSSSLSSSSLLSSLTGHPPTSRSAVISSNLSESGPLRRSLVTPLSSDSSLSLSYNGSGGQLSASGGVHPPSTSKGLVMTSTHRTNSLLLSSTAPSPAASVGSSLSHLTHNGVAGRHDTNRHANSSSIARMPVLQRTLTETSRDSLGSSLNISSTPRQCVPPRRAGTPGPPTTLINRNNSMDHPPKPLSPSWMNQNMQPVYHLLDSSASSASNSNGAANNHIRQLNCGADGPAQSPQKITSNLSRSLIATRPSGASSTTHLQLMSYQKLAMAQNQLSNSAPAGSLMALANKDNQQAGNITGSRSHVVIPIATVDPSVFLLPVQIASGGQPPHLQLGHSDNPLTSLSASSRSSSISGGHPLETLLMRTAPKAGQLQDRR